MRHFVVGFVLVAASLSVLAEDILAQGGITDKPLTSAWQILKKSAFAARELNYEGQFSYVNGDNARKVEVKHMNYGGHEVARNIVLDKSRREVYSQGDDIVIFQPTNKNVMIKKRRGKNLFPAMLPTDLSVIKGNYNAFLVGTEYVAEREAAIIELVPKDAYRYRYKIWADTQLGLILKMTLLDSDANILEQIHFDKLSMLNSKNLNWFQPKIEMDKEYVTEQFNLMKRVDNDLIVTNLPVGYQQIDHIQRTKNGNTVDQLVFSDGIGSVSIFIEPMTKGKRLKKGHMPMGSTNMCAEVIEGRQVIVVGEVPAVTVQSIAKAVSFKR
ncbi:MAG: MucB/RseB C-terminal domain-containing protein [Methylophilaceae bacterium]|nr:MucB/RseB C-terminal domain-containing protein [Methylophilaceae bacterium]